MHHALYVGEHGAMVQFRYGYIVHSIYVDEQGVREGTLYKVQLQEHQSSRSLGEVSLTGAWHLPLSVLVACLGGQIMPRTV